MPSNMGERLCVVVFILQAAYGGVLASEFPHGGGISPLFSLYGMIFLSLIMLAETVFKRKPGDEQKIDFTLTFEKMKPLLVCLLVIAYLYLIFELGYYTSTVVFLIASTVLVGVRNYKAILLTGVILFPLMYAFFELFLQANLPMGILI